MLATLEERHRPTLARILERIPEFTEDEVRVALELVDQGLRAPDPADYRFAVVERDGRACGYACWGPTPMTVATFDLYWIAVDPDAQGRGVGAELLAGVEADVRAGGGRLVRAETSGGEAYARTRRFYERAGWTLEARVRDFYWPGNDLCIYTRQVSPESCPAAWTPAGGIRR